MGKYVHSGRRRPSARRRRSTFRSGTACRSTSPKRSCEGAWPSFRASRVMYERVDQEGRTGRRIGAGGTVSSNEWPYEDEELDADYIVACDGTGSGRPRAAWHRAVWDRPRGANGSRGLLVARVPRGHDSDSGERQRSRVVNPEQRRAAWEFWGRVDAENSFFIPWPRRRRARSERPRTTCRAAWSAQLAFPSRRNTSTSVLGTSASRSRRPTASVASSSPERRARPSAIWRPGTPTTVSRT